MQDRTLYSIQESRKLLGGISRNMIYQLLRTGRLASVVIGTRRLISAEAIADLIERSTTTVSPSLRATRRSATPEQITLPLRLPSSVRARIGQGGVS
jgi:excisionase family DNA binding protein